jgi:hypothetical protein
MSEAVRVWLVERDYSDKGLVTIVYATPDGDRAVTKQRSEQMLTRTDVTAAETVDPDTLEAVEDDDLRERYAAEATRMRDSHDPDDAV